MHESEEVEEQILKPVTCSALLKIKLIRYRWLIITVIVWAPLILIDISAVVFSFFKHILTYLMLRELNLLLHLWKIWYSRTLMLTEALSTTVIYIRTTKAED